MAVMLSGVAIEKVMTSVLLVEETRGPGENHRPVASHCKLYHIMLYTSP
jgi:hypothetical protein